MENQIPIRMLCFVILLALFIGDASLKSVGQNDVNIIDGRFAKRNELPYQVALLAYSEKEDVNWVVCGGVIINRNYVLTAAHCFDQKRDHYLTKDSTLVRAGVIDYKKKNQDRRLESVTIHDKFNADEWDFFAVNHDIALLKVDKPFSFDKSVKAVSLVTEYPPPGTECTVSGWGLHNEDRTVDEDTQNKLKLAKHDIGIQLLDSIYVTDYLTGRPFEGDSGAPLVCDGHLAGILSGGDLKSKKAAGKTLTLYTNIMMYKQWLDDEEHDDEVSDF